MAMVIDLIAEYGDLTDRKIRCAGVLAPAEDVRWEELSVFFDMMMRQPGLYLPTEQSPYTLDEIRDLLTERLRVPTAGFAIVQHEEECYEARIENLSLGGAFLALPRLLDVGTHPVLYLARADQIEDVLELKGEVIWSTERGIPRSGIPRGMGVRFIDVAPEVQVRIESMIAGSIQTQLARLW